MNVSKEIEKEYKVWTDMKQRCLNQNSPRYEYYGGRGIGVCARWKNSFKDFLADMGKRPSKEHSIDRIDNDGDYEPGNCRWADRIVQANNKNSNKIIEYNSEKHTVRGWAKIRNMHEATLWTRLFRHGWPIERALFAPVRRKS